MCYTVAMTMYSSDQGSLGHGDSLAKAACQRHGALQPGQLACNTVDKHAKRNLHLPVLHQQVMHGMNGCNEARH